MSAPARMVCYCSVIDGDCVVFKDPAKLAPGEIAKVKRLPIPYADFARRVMRSRKWQLLYAGPGSFHFMRIA